MLAIAPIHYEFHGTFFMFEKRFIMATPLTDTEIYLLDKLIPSLKMTDEINLNIVMRLLADQEREYVASQGQPDVSILMQNVGAFLKEQGFVRTQDRLMYFLTEPGKNLKRAGSYEKYKEWQVNTRTKNREILHTIETRGYLDQDQIVKNRRAEMIRKYVIYPAIAVIVIIVALAVASHFKLIPKIKI